MEGSAADRVAKPVSAPSGRGSTAVLRARHALSDARHHLRRSALKLAGYVVVAFLVLKLIPSLEAALHSLEHVSWEWLVGAITLEVLSETGFVVAWRVIVDPDRVLEEDGRGRRMDQRVAWAQLGGGLVVPGGAVGGMGVGALILHRFGMPTKLIAERQLNLSFLNTTVNAFALIIFGIGLAAGIFTGNYGLLLTAAPAAVAALGVAAGIAVARRHRARADRPSTPPARHPKLANAVATLADAINDTERTLLHRGNWTSLLGSATYIGCDILVLYSAFLAVHANPLPGFAAVVMSYIIGALGGSLPLPGALGTVGGIAGMLVVYGVGHNAAIAAVLLHQAIGLLVPITGGGIAYAILRHDFGPMRLSAGDQSD